MSFIINPYQFALINPAATREYRALKTVSAQSSRNFTITGVDIGTAEAGREVVLVVFGAFNAYKAFVGGTIGGVTADVHANQATTATVAYSASIISVPLDTGSTATVTLEFTSGASSYAVWIASYKVLGLNSRTPIDIIEMQAAADPIKSGTMDVQEGGVSFSGSLNYNGNGFGLTGITEDYDSDVGGFRRCVGGSLENTADETGRTITYDLDGTSGSFRGPIVAASFR